MGRKVFISSDMCVDGRLAQIAAADGLTALLWPWLLTAFDDWGRAEADPWHLKAMLFPMNPTVSVEDIQRALERLAAAEMVTLYTVGGKPYMAIPPDKWYRYQTHIPRDKRTQGGSKYPDPDLSPIPDARTSARTRAPARQSAASRADSRASARSSASQRDLVPSPSPSPTPSPPPTPSGADPPQDASRPGPPPPDAEGDGQAAAPPGPAPSSGGTPRRLAPAVRALVTEWRAALTADGLAPPRDWHLRAGGYLTRWLQHGATVTDLRAWWAWLHEDPWWRTRYPETQWWDRAWAQWRLARTHPPGRDRPHGGGLQGAAAVEALLRADSPPSEIVIPDTEVHTHDDG
jgi:hypothetical protein